MATSDWVLRTEALVKRFGDFTVIPGLGFRVHRNTVHALIGPNGAGKTTVFNLLTKFIPATSGKIYYEGRDIRLSPADVALLGMVRSFQISAIYPELTARERSHRAAAPARHLAPFLEIRQIAERPRRPC